MLSTIHKKITPILMPILIAIFVLGMINSSIIRTPPPVVTPPANTLLLPDIQVEEWEGAQDE